MASNTKSAISAATISTASTSSPVSNCAQASPPSISPSSQGLLACTTRSRSSTIKKSGALMTKV